VRAKMPPMLPSRTRVAVTALEALRS
jgi:hypothetical protein